MSNDHSAEAMVRRPFDRFGMVCLAWTGAFLTLTAILTVAVR